MTPLRVLHSTRAATGGTKYATHMAAVAGDGVSVAFFSWPRALFGRYDVFHVHWPEALAGGSGVRGALKRALARALLLRLRAGRTAVVSTRHNPAPHEDVAGGELARRLEDLAAVEIHLVPEAARRARGEIVSIPHGSYVEPFAHHPRSAPVSGRALFTGLIRPYKGIDELLDAFAGVSGGELRIVGKPLDPALESRIASSDDPRVSHRFAFVPDAELVAEVTAADLVVLPYRELHSSGIAIVALSLGRPILVPRTESTLALRDEVGSAWVRFFDAPLSAATLSAALAAGIPEGSPDLSARTWEEVARAHRAAYRRAVELTHG
ncbi:glycosyltransferase [Microbacterium indicum]|uniref:glycosyltransferase n=1 Tax=Microbacterium indicum TaxID=358100 RepID=UPI00041E25A1|nr:glycosyltransferase [Microbacterium indicum]